mmetsp:Transcript_46247/g.72356  ORF Transcript_46247/g.72356 Transcript_46247/m.72356 type:complete len:227 (-) Transcript_46247:674-1354(-)
MQILLLLPMFEGVGRRRGIREEESVGAGVFSDTGPFQYAVGNTSFKDEARWIGKARLSPRHKKKQAKNHHLAARRSPNLTAPHHRRLRHSKGPRDPGGWGSKGGGLSFSSSSSCRPSCCPCWGARRRSGPAPGPRTPRALPGGRRRRGRRPARPRPPPLRPPPPRRPQWWGAQPREARPVWGRGARPRRRRRHRQSPEGPAAWAAQSRTWTKRGHRSPSPLPPGRG